MDMMHCEKYHCDLTEKACFKRYTFATYGDPYEKARYDACAKCDQGSKVYDRLSKGEPDMKHELNQRRCRQCNELFDVGGPDSGFYKAVGCKDGYDPVCKYCRAENKKKRSSKETNSNASTGVW